MRKKWNKYGYRGENRLDNNNKKINLRYLISKGGLRFLCLERLKFNGSYVCDKPFQSFMIHYL